MRELIKLNAFALEGFHRVVHLDMDSMVLQNMDELFDLDQDLVYTCDYNMQPGQQRARGKVPCPVQGGFVVVRPSQQAFAQMVDVVKQGRFGGPFGSGWNGTGIGHWWGGATFQGIVPFFFQHAADKQRFPSLEVDRCTYNNMVDNPIVNPPPHTGGADCRAVPLETIKNVHFTLCQKPWKCSFSRQPADEQQLCQALHARWHELRHGLEVTRGLDPSAESGKWHLGHCSHGRYQPMPLGRLGERTSPLVIVPPS